MSELIDAKTTAELIKHHRTSLNNLVEAGAIPPPIKVGRKKLWDRERLLEHIGAKSTNPRRES